MAENTNTECEVVNLLVALWKLQSETWEMRELRLWWFRLSLRGRLNDRLKVERLLDEVRIGNDEVRAVSGGAELLTGRWWVKLWVSFDDGSWVGDRRCEEAKAEEATESVEDCVAAPKADVGRGFDEGAEMAELIWDILARLDKLCDTVHH